MNKYAYRVIFSEVRGMFIAVAENVKSKCKTSGQSCSVMQTSETGSSHNAEYKKLNILSFCVVGLLGAAILTVPLASIGHAQIIADKTAPNAQKPTVLKSGNGTPQVNIQTPSAAGVSRNSYSQFDVAEKGAILNNSRNNTQTQIGGWVQGNPWLAKGEAKVILNEVNSAHPSQLKGYIEVAGKQAQVVIANPSGLVCDGCGVINADRFTLTTGQAVMNQGYLESFRVREGQVTISGKGLNGSLTPYTDIYSRALILNAGLYANQLNTVLGVNEIEFQAADSNADPAFKASQSTASNTSQFSLDIGQMGGMYAGKIFLVGNEHGLGMRNAGSINSTTDKLVLTAHGDLINSGNIIANKEQVQIQAQNINNIGNVSSSTSQVLLQSQNLNNSGMISSADELYLNNQNQMMNSGKLNAARIAVDTDSLKNTGAIEQTGLQALDIQAGKMSNLGGKIGIAKTAQTGGNGETGTGGVTTAPTLPTDPTKDGGTLGVVTPPIETTPKTYEAGYIHVKNNFENDQGAIVANGGVDLASQDGLNNVGGELSLGALLIKGEVFNNDQGKLTIKKGDIQTQRFTNISGQLLSNQELKIASQNVNNQKGKIQSVAQLDMNISGELNNIEGQIASNATINIAADNLNNQKGVIYSEKQSINLNVGQDIDNTDGLIQAAVNLNLNSQTLNNSSGQIFADQLIQKHSTVKNDKGSIVGQQKLQSSVEKFDNKQGQIQGGTVLLEHRELSNSGSIYADQDLEIFSENIENTGSIAAGKNTAITSVKLEHSQTGIIAAGLNKEGKLNNTGDLSIEVDYANLHGQSFATKNLNVASKYDIDASNGQLQAENVILESSLGNVSTESGSVIAQHQLNISGRDLINNHQGKLSAQTLILNAKYLDNSLGEIQHIGSNDFTLNFENGINNQEGEIQTNADTMHLNASIFNNESGKLTHAGKQKLEIQVKKLDGIKGQILTNGELELSADQITFDEGITSADQINISAKDLSHKKGQMVQSGANNTLNLNIENDLNNQQGIIATQNGLNIQAGSANNQAGQFISGQGDLNLTVQDFLDNSNAGQIVSGQNSIIQAGSILNSQKGKISAIDSLQIISNNTINNQSGQMVANQDILIESQGLDNSEGHIGTSQGQLDIKTGLGALNNTLGSIQAEKDLNIFADSIQNQAGLINSQNNLNISAEKDISNIAGKMIANQNINILSHGLNNDQGQIGSVEGEIKLDAGAGDLKNRSGKIQSAQDLTINAYVIENQSGLISAQKQLFLNSQILSNKKGQIQRALLHKPICKGFFSDIIFK